MSNIDDLAKQIGDAVMDAIEQNRRINKGDLIDAAHNVLRRRQALLAVDGLRAQLAAPTWINHRPPGMDPKPSKRARLIVRAPDGTVERVTEEEAAVLYGACCQRE